MVTKTFVERTGDMHPTRKLRFTQQSDGDIIMSIVQDGWPVGDTDTGSASDRAGSIEFSLSGGRSPRLHAALVEAMAAMKAENELSPIP